MLGKFFETRAKMKLQNLDKKTNLRGKNHVWHRGNILYPPKLERIGFQLLNLGPRSTLGWPLDFPWKIGALNFKMP